MRQLLSKLLEYFGNTIAIAMGLSLLIEFPIITSSILICFIAFVFYLDYIAKKIDERYEEDKRRLIKSGMSESEVYSLLSGPENIF